MSNDTRNMPDELPSHDPLAILQRELDELDLAGVIQRLEQRTNLAKSTLAAVAQDDAAKWTRLVRGTETRPLTPKQIDTLMTGLPFEPDIRVPLDDAELAVWRRALTVASQSHQVINNIRSKREADSHPLSEALWSELEANIRQIFCEFYDDKGGRLPAMLPFPFVLPERRTHRFVEPKLARVPAGYSWMGSDNSDSDATDNERPQHQRHLPEYWIGRYPITNEEYNLFLLANPDHPSPLFWDDYKLQKSQWGNHPVTGVTWHDAFAYCRWLSKVTGNLYKLPSEAQWEKAARGTDRRIYPWGNRFDKDRLNSSEGGVEQTKAVGEYTPHGDGPYGCADMVGNIWEWTCSLWGKDWAAPDFKYPYDPFDGRENLEAPDDFARVLRGGSFLYSRQVNRCAYRYAHYPDFKHNDCGFRIVGFPSTSGI